MSGRSQLAAKDPQERRRRILAAAIEVLEDKGFAGTRIADIAAVAGTSPALVVYHFKTLDGALAEALGSVEDDFYHNVSAATPPNAGAIEQLRILSYYASVGGPAVGTWALYMEVWVRALRDGGARAMRRAVDARWRHTLTELITAGIDEGVFTCEDPQAAALRLAALMDGLAVQAALADMDVPDEEMNRLWLEAAAIELDVDPRLLLEPISTVTSMTESRSRKSGTGN
jgi:AcrR family transcriptional regulator